MRPCAVPFSSAAPSFNACKIRRRVGSAIACNARSRDASLEDIDQQGIARESMAVNVGKLLACGKAVEPVSQCEPIGNHLLRFGVQHLSECVPRILAALAQQTDVKTMSVQYGQLLSSGLLPISGTFSGWLPPVGGLLAAAAVAFLCGAPLSPFAFTRRTHRLCHRTSAGSAPRKCGNRMGPLRDSHARSTDIRGLVLQTSFNVLWLAPLALLIRENSPWTTSGDRTAVLLAGIVNSIRLLQVPLPANQASPVSTPAGIPSACWNLLPPSGGRSAELARP